MRGVPGRTHCGRWIRADHTKHGTGRLVCTLPACHSGEWHRSGWSGWYWSVRRPALGHGREPVPVRDWCCGCGRTAVGCTEDEVRVRGWRVGWRHGERDVMCPVCARPDPDLVRLCTELAQSTRRHQ